MPVFILVLHYLHEGTSNEAVYLSKEDADRECAKRNKENADKNKWWEIDDMEAIAKS